MKNFVVASKISWLIVIENSRTKHLWLQRNKKSVALSGLYSCFREDVKNTQTWRVFAEPVTYCLINNHVVFHWGYQVASYQLTSYQHNGWRYVLCIVIWCQRISKFHVVFHWGYQVTSYQHTVWLEICIKQCKLVRVNF